MDVPWMCPGCAMGYAASMALTIDDGQVRVALRSANGNPPSGDRQLWCPESAGRPALQRRPPLHMHTLT